MVRTGFGVRGVALGVSGALLYLASLSTLSFGQAFVVSPSASRACSAAAQGSWRGSSSSSSRPRIGAGGVRARKLRGLEVAAGESAVESSSVAEGDAMRVGQIEAFADKHLLAFNENVTLAELNEVEPFSQGGFCVICSCVYRGQQAVLKIPKPATASSRSGGAAQDLLREISIYRQISQRGGHPNIARAFGAGTHVQQGETSPSPFLLLERLEGGTLENAFERSTAVWSDPIGRLPVAIELTEAVAFLHEAAIPGGVVLHRDLKPSNIGLCGAGHIKVFDLGLSVVRQVLEAPTRVYEVMEGMAADGMDSSFMSIFGEFLGGYSKCAIKAGTTPQQFQFSLGTLIKMVPENMKKPYEFELFHESTRDPVDLYTWGNDFFRPLIELDNSRLEGKENLEKIAEYLTKGENVFLMSNHQTEADPQVISLLMEREGYGDEASRLINVAGHRVTTDPLAIPFSMGRNLFCIFSKKYMETPPELKGEKQKHNVRTLKKMAEMMSEGGQFIWVAPSGGRDRPDPETGKFVVSPYDPKSVEVFRLMAAKAMGRNKAGPVTHFFPFAMWTNKLVPPPDQVNKELGERRQADRGPASVAFGEEVLPPPGETLKKAEFVAIMEERVQAEYAKLDEFHESKQK